MSLMNRSRSLLRWTLVSACAALAACTSTDPQGPPQEKSAAPSGTTAPAGAASSSQTVPAAASPEEIARLTGRLQIAELELVRARGMALDQMTKAEEELDLATQKLTQFEKVDAPLRVEKAKLDLERSRDQLADAQEELDELKMMYANADLADKTRDIVMHRTERRLARQKAGLALAERDFDILQQYTLPQDLLRLKLDANARMSEKRNAESAWKIDELNRSLARDAAQAELKKAAPNGQP